MATVVKNRNYRDDLVEQIKAAGQELIDRADQMLGPEVDLISGFNIYISFGHGSIPEIDFTTTVLSKNNHKLILSRYDKVKE